MVEGPEDLGREISVMVNGEVHKVHNYNCKWCGRELVCQESVVCKRPCDECGSAIINCGNGAARLLELLLRRIKRLEEKMK